MHGYRKIIATVPSARTAVVPESYEIIPFAIVIPPRKYSTPTRERFFLFLISQRSFYLFLFIVYVRVCTHFFFTFLVTPAFFYKRAFCTVIILLLFLCTCTRRVREVETIIFAAAANPPWQIICVYIYICFFSNGNDFVVVYEMFFFSKLTFTRFFSKTTRHRFGTPIPVRPIGVQCLQWSQFNAIVSVRGEKRDEIVRPT